MKSAHYEICQIDAYRDDAGTWSWNDVSSLGLVVTLPFPPTDEQILQALAASPLLDIENCFVEEYGENFEIQDSATLQPLLALEIAGLAEE